MKPEYRNFSLQTLAVFLSKSRFMSAGFTIGQKQYEHILCGPHRARVQDSGHKGSSHIRHLIGCTEFQSLFLAFKSGCSRCLETNSIVKHMCLRLQEVSLSSKERGSLKSPAFHCYFLSPSRFLFCGKNLATNPSWKERMFVSSFFCHADKPHSFRVPLQVESH